jgi:hypothetical protein
MQALPYQALTSSSTNSVDMRLLDTLVLLAASYSGGAWLAPAWPRFGAVVAGLSYRAAMDAAMDLQVPLPLLLPLSLLHLLHLLELCLPIHPMLVLLLLLHLRCSSGAMLNPTAAMLMLI